MAKNRLIGVFILLLIIPEVTCAGGLVCYATCMTAVAAGAVVAGPAAIGILGFTPNGVVAGSWAASWMSMYGGNVGAGSLFATLQSVGATGVFKYTGIPHVNAVCTHLCY